MVLGLERVLAVELSATKNKGAGSFGKLMRLLKSLKLIYREHEKGSAVYHISVPAFGIVFRFNPAYPSETNYRGWDIIDISPEDLDQNINKFTEDLIWMLIDKGYFSYLRHDVSGGKTLYHRLLNYGGWGKRIIEQRLKYWNNQPKHKYLIELNKKHLSYSISYITTYYPDFFDHLL